MANCPKCGVRVATGRRSCNNCGAFIEDDKSNDVRSGSLYAQAAAQDVDDELSAKQQSSQPARPEAPAHPKFFLIGTMVAVAVIAGIGGALLMMGGGDGDDGLGKSDLTLQYSAQGVDGAAVAEGEPFFSVTNVGTAAISLGQVRFEAAAPGSDDFVAAVPYVDIVDAKGNTIEPGSQMRFTIPADMPTGLADGGSMRLRIIETATGAQVGATQTVRL